MHDLSYFRNHFEQVAARLATRSNPPSLEGFLELDRRRRAAITKTEQLKAAANKASGEIGPLLKDGKDASAQREQVRVLKAEIASLDEQVKVSDNEFQELLTGIPNVPHESVPVGKD